MQSDATLLLENMHVRRNRRVLAPGLVMNIVEASFEGDGTGKLEVESPLILLPLRGRSRDGLRRLKELRMTGSTPPGRITILPPHTTLHGWLGGKVASISFIATSLDLAELARLNEDNQGVPELLPRLGAEDADLVAALNWLRRDAENPGFSSRLFIDSVAALVRVLVLRNHSTQSDEIVRTRHRSMSDNRLRLVQDYLEQNLSEDMPLSDLAAMAELSPFHFCRAFKQATGRSPHRYRIERRVERAKQLLADPNYPVGAIASACGFASASHFATTFSRMTGRSPSRFRREI